MVKSPVEYFESQNFDASVAPQGAMSAAELAFVQKYMGMDAGKALTSVPVVVPESDEPPAPGGAPAPARPAMTGAPVAVEPLPVEEQPIEVTLREAESVQLVGFYVGSQLYALPTLAIQEVIRRLEPAPLPMAPTFVSGVINLRGHITPLIRMRKLLDMPLEGVQPERFTIICRCQGLQFGVEIDQLQTMYRIMQQDLNWNAEASVGANVEFITGLFEVEDKLIPIISIDRLVEKVLNA